MCKSDWAVVTNLCSNVTMTTDLFSPVPMYRIAVTFMLAHNLILSSKALSFMRLFSRYEDLKMDNAAYPFLAFSGIPSVSFRFTPGNSVSNLVFSVK